MAHLQHAVCSCLAACSAPVRHCSYAWDQEFCIPSWPCVLSYDLTIVCKPTSLDIPWWDALPSLVQRRMPVAYQWSLTVQCPVSQLVVVSLPHRSKQTWLQVICCSASPRCPVKIPPHVQGCDQNVASAERYTHRGWRRAALPQHRGRGHPK